MRKNTFFLASLIAISTVVFSFSCNNQNASNQGQGVDSTSASASAFPPFDTIGFIREKPLTSEEQQALTPDLVIQRLKDGNQRFVTSSLTTRDHSALIRASVSSQYPEAVILTCIDSRIPVEDVFDKAIGDLFVARVAGNFVNEDILGSMEYGCKEAGAKLILVMGHESCGAIKAAIDGVKMGNITVMLSRIAPALKMSRSYQGDETSKNIDFVAVVAKNNVLNTIATIRAKSPLLKEMEGKGQIKIIGAYYSLQTGTVTFL
jgi:carbonic anhydrase